MPCQGSQQSNHSWTVSMLARGQNTSKRRLCVIEHLWPQLDLGSNGRRVGFLVECCQNHCLKTLPESPESKRTGFVISYNRDEPHQPTTIFDEGLECFPPTGDLPNTFPSLSWRQRYQVAGRDDRKGNSLKRSMNNNLSRYIGATPC